MSITLKAISVSENKTEGYKTIEFLKPSKGHSHEQKFSALILKDDADYDLFEVGKTYAIASIAEEKKEETPVVDETQIVDTDENKIDEELEK